MTITELINQLNAILVLKGDLEVNRTSAGNYVGPLRSQDVKVRDHTIQHGRLVYVGLDDGS